MAFSFNGTNQYLSNGAALVSAYPVTMVAYGKCGRSTGYNSAIGVGSSSASNNVQLVWAGADAGTPIAAYIVNLPAFPAAKSTTGYTTNTWQSGAAIFTNSTSRNAYLNAANGGSDATSQAFPSVDRTAIGAIFQSGATNYFQGDLCECAIWDAALTVAELTSLSKGFKPHRIRPQSLIFYAPLVRNVQDVVAGLALTNNNTATASNHPRVY